MDSTTAAAKVDKIVRDRLDASMIKLRRRGPHFATEVSELLQLREASYEGIELHEDGIQTIPSRTAKATVIISVIVEQRCCNFSDNAHGGFLAYLIDICSSMPLILLSGPTMWHTAGRKPNPLEPLSRVDFPAGVSANINVNYLAAIPVGTEINVISTDRKSVV